MWTLPTTVLGLVSLIIFAEAGIIIKLWATVLKIQSGKEEILRSSLQNDNTKFNTLQEALTIFKELNRKK